MGKRKSKIASTVPRGTAKATLRPLTARVFQTFEINSGAIELPADVEIE
jgi:hypothetical protein